MKRVMLVGESGTGKSALIRALSGEEFVSRRAMSLEFFGRFINTPGEFLENRRFYRALITASMDADILLMIQDATRGSSLFPPQFAATFNRKIIGVITRIDSDGANTERAERFLRNAAVKEILQVSTESGAGIDALRELLD